MNHQGISDRDLKPCCMRVKSPRFRPALVDMWAQSIQGQTAIDPWRSRRLGELQTYSCCLDGLQVACSTWEINVPLLEMVCTQWSQIMKHSCLLSCSMKKYVGRMDVITYLWCEATLRLFATIRRSYNTSLELSNVWICWLSIGWF